MFARLPAGRSDTPDDTKRTDLGPPMSQRRARLA